MYVAGGYLQPRLEVIFNYRFRPNYRSNLILLFNMSIQELSTSTCLEQKIFEKQSWGI